MVLAAVTAAPASETDAAARAANVPGHGAVAGSAGEAGLVSVVIIFLDEERYLRDAVESVRAQTYSRWELLLVDDGSTDASPEIARRLADEDPRRIRCLAHPDGANRGMSASRNLGLAHARGEYVAFLDADDLYLPERLQRHVEVLAAYPDIRMTVSDHVRWFIDRDAEQDPAPMEFARPFFAVGDQVWRPPLGLIVIMGAPSLGLGICNVTVRRRTALEVGGFDSRFTAMYEDQVFISRMLARHPVYVLQAYLARYRHHPASFTRRLKEAGGFHDRVAHGDTSRFVDWLLAHLRESGIDDPLLHEIVAARRGGEPGAVQRLRLALGAPFKRALRALLPGRCYRRLLQMDYERESRRARRSYDRLAAVVSRRALDRAAR